MTDSCASCAFALTGRNNNLECHFNAPLVDTAALWPPVKSTDWCGEWQPVGYQNESRYLSGYLHLTTLARALILTTGGDPIFTVVAMRSCQLANNGNQVANIQFSDAATGGSILANLTIAANASSPVNFSVPIVAMTGALYAALASAGDVNVSAQGSMERP